MSGAADPSNRLRENGRCGGAGILDRRGAPGSVYQDLLHDSSRLAVPLSRQKRGCKVGINPYSPFMGTCLYMALDF